MPNITETITELTQEEAAELIEAMRAAVDTIPSYVETRAYQQWLENALESDASNHQ